MVGGENLAANGSQIVEAGRVAVVTGDCLKPPPARRSYCKWRQQRRAKDADGLACRPQQFIGSSSSSSHGNHLDRQQNAQNHYTITSQEEKLKIEKSQAISSNNSHHFKWRIISSSRHEESVSSSVHSQKLSRSRNRNRKELASAEGTLSTSPAEVTIKNHQQPKLCSRKYGRLDGSSSLLLLLSSSLRSRDLTISHYRWPHLSTRSYLLVCIALLLLSCLQSDASRQTNRRIVRQLSASNSWRGHQIPSTFNGNQQPAQQNVPYKTFYVTRACEWRSNLFVPKSNDIHFAQPTTTTTTTQHLTVDQQQQQHQPIQESSVAYETLGANSNYAAATRISGSGGQFQQQQQQYDSSSSSSRIMLSTDSKALILAIPVVMSQSFAGYESACSIRLIVPRNMRILAKLTSRRLTFAQQQLDELADFEQQQQQDQLQSQQPYYQQQQQQQPAPSLWLNVSQNKFIETEQRIIETKGNVLAFRFLLERFASKQAPDIRFQVVLTAFQTLSENSDLNGAGQVWPSGGRPASGSGSAALEPNAQFICDQQRLISANLACDGFKNCQDGQDEEQATCLALRSSQLPEFSGGNIAANGLQQFPPPTPPIRDQTSGGDLMANDKDSGSFWVRTWNYVRDTHSLAGFFLGFLLVLALLTCCSCCIYLAYALYRHQRHHFRSRRRDELGGNEQGEADHLASAQNSENAARLERSAAGSTTINKPQLPPPARLHSILKQRPVEPPPAVPERPQRALPEVSTSLSGSKRGALSSSISRGQATRSSGGVAVGASQFKPTPAKRLTRPTRPVPLAPSGPSRPPASATQPTSTSTTFAAQQGASPSSQQRQQKGVITTSVTGTQRVTTYHYSSGTTRLSESYLQRLASEQKQQQQPRASGSSAPPTDPNVNYKREQSSVSPQSSLI